MKPPPFLGLLCVAAALACDNPPSVNPHAGKAAPPASTEKDVAKPQDSSAPSSSIEKGGSNVNEVKPLRAAAEPIKSDMVLHRDEPNGFAIGYPQSWSIVPATHAPTKLKIVSKGGEGEDDFNVVVITNPAFKKLTADQLVSMNLDRPEEMLAMIRRGYPDAQILKSGKTHLDNKTAYYVIFDATYRAFELEVPMRFLQVSTIHAGRAYYLTSRTGPGEFDAKKPIFTLIMGGFKFLDR